MILKKGSQGSAVSKIQYKVGEHPDGIFGSGTEQNVKKWQEANGVDADGIIGPNTWKQMFGCSIDEFSPIGVVVHSMTEFIDWEGEEITARQLLDKLGLGIHALIHPDGRVEEVIPTTQKAAHAGKSVHNGLSNLNSFFVGFELLVEGKNDYGSFIKKIDEEGCYTDAQFESAVNLTKQWMETYNIEAKDVVRHSDVSGDHVRGEGKGKVDPGHGFDWNKFVEHIS
jgi:N-acetyl-anhydromuramyl-L-alanine amidase AmpD